MIDQFNIRLPFHKFADDSTSLGLTHCDGDAWLTASDDVFEDGHVGTVFRLETALVRIAGVLSPTEASVLTDSEDASWPKTKDWEEQAWSSVRGGPLSSAMHQGRLAVGGSRDLPNRLWFSKLEQPFNFDLGTGLDDDAIEFAILSDQVNAITRLEPNRGELLVLTEGAEWTVSGDPITPSSVMLQRTRRL